MDNKKLGTTEKAKDNRFAAVMTTALFAMLMISQLALASEKTKTSYILDNNYGSLESNTLQGNDNNIDIFTPDFLHAVTVLEQQIPSFWADYDSSVEYVENHSIPYLIRGPPQNFS